MVRVTLNMIEKVDGIHNHNTNKAADVKNIVNKEMKVVSIPDNTLDGSEIKEEHYGWDESILFSSTEIRNKMIWDFSTALDIMINYNVYY